MGTRATHRWPLTIAALALILGACGGDSGSDTTLATSTTQTSTTEAPTTTAAATTTTPAPTTTVAEETTTTMAPFDLAGLSAEEQDTVNYICAWATEVPRQPNGQLFNVDPDILRLQLLAGELIEPFRTATEEVELTDVDEVRAALAGACVEFGAPTEEYLSRFA